MNTDLTAYASEQQHRFDASTSPDERKQQGHFGTPPAIAHFMAGQFSWITEKMELFPGIHAPERKMGLFPSIHASERKKGQAPSIHASEPVPFSASEPVPFSASEAVPFSAPEQSGIIRVLDPGAGVGTLSAAVCQRVLAETTRHRLFLELWENDPRLEPYLRRTMEHCRKALRTLGRWSINSALVDRYFRTISGNTQVNATEIRTMPVPDLPTLVKIGRMVQQQTSREYPEIERIVGKALQVPECLIAHMIHFNGDRFLGPYPQRSG